jgi:hypothetical protein
MNLAEFHHNSPEAIVEMGSLGIILLTITHPDLWFHHGGPLMSVFPHAKACFSTGPMK